MGDNHFIATFFILLHGQKWFYVRNRAFCVGLHQSVFRAGIEWAVSLCIPLGRFGCGIIANLGLAFVDGFDGSWMGLCSGSWWFCFLFLVLVLLFFFLFPGLEDSWLWRLSCFHYSGGSLYWMPLSAMGVYGWRCLIGLAWSFLFCFLFITTTLFTSRTDTL